jgi:hypothetical protein
MDEIARLLAESTGLQLHPVCQGQPGGGAGWDAILEVPGGTTFLVEFKAGAGVEAVGAALRQIEALGPPESREVPLLVVPFMGEVGKSLCERAGVAWLDLSGNARITTPGLRVVIEGRPNRHARRGRPSDPFAPQASRISRTLLLDPEAEWAQSALVRQTGVDKGFVSRILKRLEASGFVDRAGGTVRVPRPAELLAAWRAAYDFSRHEIVPAVVAARSGPELLRRVSEALGSIRVRHAATGLAAAWAHAPFATYRSAAVYVERRPDAAALAKLGARETPAGANLRLVVPNDEGVFSGAGVVDGVPCVSPLQAYLDLKGAPERAEEAAEELRRVHLPWADA